MQGPKPGSPDTSRLRIAVVVPVLAVAVGLLVLAAVVSRTFHPLSHGARQPDTSIPISDAGAPDSTRQDSSTNHLAAGQDSASPAKSATASVSLPAETADSAAVQNASTNAAPEKKQFLAAEQISALDDVMNSDRPENEKLGVALATLGNPDKKVRDAALAAVKDLDDRDAIPRLKELAAHTDNPEEKAALLDVADFLDLPSFTGYATTHSGSGKITPAPTSLSKKLDLLKQKRKARQAAAQNTPQTQPAAQP